MALSSTAAHLYGAPD